MSKFLGMKESGVIIPTIVLLIAVQIINPIFLSGENIINILRSSSFTLMTALGMTFVMIAGGIDLSVGSVVGIGGVITGIALTHNLPIFVGVLLGILTGVVIGYINGYIITKFKIAPLMMTLGTLYIARGIIYVLTQGVPVYPLPEAFEQMEQGYFLSIPMVCWISFILAGIAYLMLTQTTFGRSVYAVGGNPEAARLSGIKVRNINYAIYAMCGGLSATTGVFMASRLGSAQAGAGTGFELTVVAAVVIGGTSTFGGSGTILGTIIGVLFTNLLANSMTILKISIYWQSLIIGLVLVLAVIVDGYKRKKSIAGWKPFKEKQNVYIGNAGDDKKVWKFNCTEQSELESKTK